MKFGASRVYKPPKVLLIDAIPGTYSSNLHSCLSLFTTALVYGIPRHAPIGLEELGEIQYFTCRYSLSHAHGRVHAHAHTCYLSYQLKLTALAI